MENLARVPRSYFQPRFVRDLNLILYFLPRSPLDLDLFLSAFLSSIEVNNWKYNKTANNSLGRGESKILKAYLTFPRSHSAAV